MRFPVTPQISDDSSEFCSTIVLLWRTLFLNQLIPLVMNTGCFPHTIISIHNFHPRESLTTHSPPRSSHQHNPAKDYFSIVKCIDSPRGQ